MGPVVTFRAAVVLLGRFPALAGLDLDVDAGEIVMLRGPNGAGKTTLLRACAGLAPVTQGSAHVLGCDLVADARQVRRMVALASADDGLYGELSVSANVEFWADAAGIDHADAYAALDVMAVPTRVLDLAVDRLSTGQRRRVALSVLMARRPRLWLLDEPHAGLDPDGRAVVDSLVARAAADGATVLMASHELDHAAVATRTVTIAGGVVAHDTRPRPGDAAQPEPQPPVAPTSAPAGEVPHVG